MSTPLSATFAVLLVALSAATSEAQVQLRENYSAQRKPRVAVMKFENTNDVAKKQAFGESVSAMLGTFLKRKSQFVVVERQNLDKVLSEWKLEGAGATEASGAPSVLSSIDAILDGRVTVLTTAQGDEIEIDARLISKRDAHIISAGHQSGPTACLRATVEQLGIELEQGFLRPYYGTLTVTVSEPVNARIYLTPVLASGALDDEKPPLELDRTVSAQNRSAYEKWITKPTQATISNLLVGWYTIRIEHPGYEGVGTDNFKLVIQDAFGQAVPAAAGSAAPGIGAEPRQFLIQIKPLETTRWPLDGAPVRLRKMSGSVTLKIKRQYVDTDFKDARDLPDLATFLRAEKVDVNDLDDLVSKDDDADKCRKDRPVTAAFLSIMESLRACTSPISEAVLESFKVGDLAVHNYHRFAKDARSFLPTGSYKVQARHPTYDASTDVVFDVTNSTDDRTVLIELRRQLGTLTLFRAGTADAPHHLRLVGRETRFERQVALDFTGRKDITDLPVDTYVMTTDIPGFEKWQSVVRLEPTARPSQPQATAEKFFDDTCELVPDKPLAMGASIEVKMHPWLSGRVDSLNLFQHVNLVRRPLVDALESALMTEEAKKDRAQVARPNNAQSLLIQSGGPTPTASTQQDPVEILRSALRLTDLLYLNDRDMSRLAAVPRVGAVVREYIDRGGALFCFVSTPADYSSVLGAAIPLNTTAMRQTIELYPGVVPSVQLTIRQQLTTKRNIPLVRHSTKEPLSEWRVLAFRKKGKEPAILERGTPDTGGYVMVWLDTPADLLTHEATRETIAEIEKRAIAWGQYLMYRRFGPGSSEFTTAKDRLDTVLNLKRDVRARR
jgi:TolB-like protein